MTLKNSGDAALIVTEVDDKSLTAWDGQAMRVHHEGGGVADFELR